MSTALGLGRRYDHFVCLRWFFNRSRLVFVVCALVLGCDNGQGKGPVDDPDGPGNDAEASEEPPDASMRVPPSIPDGAAGSVSDATLGADAEIEDAPRDGGRRTSGPDWEGRIRVVGVTEKPLTAEYRARWTTAVNHTHNLRSGEVRFDRAKAQLVEWTRQQDIDVLGVGSPWEPVSKAHFVEYEGPRRDAYYAGRVEPGSVIDREPIAALFDELNRRSTDTLFYQGHETPKNRYGHVWYFGYEYLHPGWHDYSQDRPVKLYEADPHIERNSITGEPHWRRSALEVVWEQRAHGAVAVWAHPTSWWRSEGDFTTNIATESLLHLLADGRLGGLVVMGYDAFRPSYQALWFHYLDTGAIVPGFAETDYALDSAELPSREIIYENYIKVPADRLRSAQGLAQAVRHEPHFASSGPYVALSADGREMGQTTATSAGAVHAIEVEAYPTPGRQQLERLELVGKGGEVLHATEDFSGGVLELELKGRDAPHYVVARVFGDAVDDPQRFAVSNPVYFHPEDFRFEPVTTAMMLTVREDSPWLGGELAIEHADGQVIARDSITPGRIERTVPANARVRLTKEGREERLFYIAIENERAQALMRSIYEGDFLGDHPALEPGEVPAEVFRIDAMREALQRFSHTI